MTSISPLSLPHLRHTILAVKAFYASYTETFETATKGGTALLTKAKCVEWEGSWNFASLYSCLVRSRSPQLLPRRYDEILNLLENWEANVKAKKPHTQSQVSFEPQLHMVGKFVFYCHLPNSLPEKIVLSLQASHQCRRQKTCEVFGLVGGRSSRPSLL